MSFQAAEGFSQNLIMPMIDLIPVAITVTDLEGRILYYNGYADQILDRKPEYLGKDIRVCHEKNESTARIDTMLAEFKAGRTEAFYYEADRYGHRIEVTLTPFDYDNKRLGCIQSVTIKK